MIQYFKLEEVTELITCGVAKRPEYVEDGIPFLSAKNVKEDKIIYKDYKYVSEETHAQLTKHNKPLKGDILYTRVGSYGSASVIDVDMEFSIFVSLTLIKPKKDILNSRYLMYYLNSPKIKNLASNSINGVGVGNLNVGTVRKFPIPVPSLQEQEKIVDRLDKVFNNVDLNLKNTEHTDFEIDKLFTSIIHEIFLEKEVRLGNLIELNYGKDLDKKERGDKYKIPLYGSNGIMDFASKPLYDGKSVIVGRKGSVGELQYVEVPFWVIDVGFYVTLTNKDHLMRYYYYLLKSLNLQNLSTGVKPGLNRNKVYEILVPKHDLNQQKKNC